MMTQNADVGNNLANGTQGHCLGITLKVNATFHFRSINDMKVKCFFASDVASLMWEVNNKIHLIQPKQYKSIQANFPLPSDLQASTCTKKATVHLRATQIPLISDNATTGHKLQGASIHNLYVPSWNYDQNWPYVVLSRVRTLKGLFLGKPLDPSKDYSVPQALTRMLDSFRTFLSPSPFNYIKLAL